MKIIVFGDIHGVAVNLMRLVPEIAAADMAVFVGDGAGSLEVLDADARAKLVAVRGNCDFFCGLPCEVFIDGIFVTHGHHFGVKGGLPQLVEAAKSQNAKLCFFGHNHKQSHDVIDGISFINPGTLGNTRTAAPGQYAVVDLLDNGISVEFKSVYEK